MLRHPLLPPLCLALAACTSALEAPRATTTPAQLRARVGAYVQPTPEARLAVVKAQLEAAGLTYIVEEFDGKRPQSRGYNVIVPALPASGREILLVAHYDAFTLPSGALVDGVIDNASSVVVMIDAAARIGRRTRHPLRLLLTDQEELGLRGAYAYIAAHGVAQLGGVINADITGSGDTLIYGLNSGAQSALLLGAVQTLCLDRAVPCLGLPQYPPGDDLAFSTAGAATLSIGFLPRMEAQQLRALLQNPTATPDPSAVPEILRIIHTDEDTLDRVEGTTLARASDLIVALVLKLDALLE